MQIPVDHMTIMTSGLLTAIVFLLVIRSLNRKVVLETLSKRLPIKSFDDLTMKEKLYVANYLYKLYKTINKKIKLTIKQNYGQDKKTFVANGDELPNLFAKRDLSYHLYLRIVDDYALNDGEIRTLNEMYQKKDHAFFKVVSLNHLKRKYVDTTERIEKMNELKSKGYFLIEGFGYVCIQSRNEPSQNV